MIYLLNLAETGSETVLCLMKLKYFKHAKHQYGLDRTEMEDMVSGIRGRGRAKVDTGHQRHPGIKMHETG